MNGLRISLAAGVAAAIALVCMPAQADEQSGLALGVRTGYGVPMGAAKSGLSLGSLEGGKIPLWVNLGYRFSPNLYVGAFFEYGITFIPVHTCGSGGGGTSLSCNSNDMRGGIDFQYHFMPKQTFDPWAGLGVGYEASRVYYEQNPGVETSTIFYGLQYLDLQLGGDIRASKVVPFGPFVDLSFGKFNYESNKNANGISSDVPMESRLHEWLTLGVRGQFNL